MGIDITSFFKPKMQKTKKYGKKETLVLIGTVKSVNQYEICFSEGFYYIPLSLLVPEVFSFQYQLNRIKYVSIYQSVSLFKEASGIKYIGAVESFSVVKRREITSVPKNSNSLCVLFKISEWIKLDCPISCSEMGIYPFEIVPFENFKASRDTTELMLDSSEDRELYRLLIKLSTDINFRNFVYFDFEFEDYNDNLILRKDGECYLQLPMEVIREMPFSGFETVKNAMENK